MLTRQLSAGAIIAALGLKLIVSYGDEPEMPMETTRRVSSLVLIIWNCMESATPTGTSCRAILGVEKTSEDAFVSGVKKNEYRLNITKNLMQS